MSAALAGAGIATDIAGTVLKGIAAEDARDEMLDVANTPGLDTGAITGQALADMLRYLPQGSELARKISELNQANLNAQEEAALPGVGKARKTALDRISGLFSDDATVEDYWLILWEFEDVCRATFGVESVAQRLSSVYC